MEQLKIEKNHLTSKKMFAILKELNPLDKKHMSGQDDVTLARIFAEVIKNYARFNTSAKTWYVYDGVIWKSDDRLIIENYAKYFSDAIMAYLNFFNANQTLNFADFRDYYKAYNRVKNRGVRTKLIDDAKDIYPIKETDLNEDKYLFNCRNCVINLKTMKTQKHDPNLLLTKVANAEYNPGASSMSFEKFMDEIMQGNQAKIDYIQTLLGYALLGENTQEELYIFYGKTTRNGKSTLLGLIAKMFGDYGSNIEPETLAQRDRNSRNASGDLARLAGCRFLQVSEPPKRMKFDVGLVKKLTGRDKLTARFLYGNEFEFTPVFKLFMNTNYLPLVLDNTLFSSGRVKVVTFDRHFAKNEQDIHLREKLETTENLSGILNWCLQGLKKYKESGETITPPQEVLDATANYCEDSDKLQMFVRDRLIDSPGHNLPFSRIYEAYSAWCIDNGFGVDNKSNFKEDFNKKFTLSKSGTVNGVTTHNVLKDYDFA